MKMNMFTKHNIQILIIFLFCAVSVVGQSPKREMRSSWLTTVWQLDWPSITVPATGTATARETAIENQKQQLINILNSLQEENVNAVFFQIRSMCDAMYKSSYEPWSSFISSTRGADPGYDPLEFAIEEAHKRGMELHAWINPYRYSSSQATHGNLTTDYVNTHPTWLMAYDSCTKILNPGNPEVVQRITDIVSEVVTNYDVDGIVFDDYFYISGGTSDALDQTEFDTYNPNGLSRADWRRANCDTMIAHVYNKIQEIKPYVTFGVSPAGVAASSLAVAAKYGVTPAPAGTDWQYDGIYSDPLAWISGGILDYISPQIYWTTTSSASYAKLAPWWSEVANKFGKHFYSSHSLSAMSGPDSAPQSTDIIVINKDNIPVKALSPIEKTNIFNREKTDIQRSSAATNFTFSELGLQIDYNRNSDLNGAPGSVFYATTKAIDIDFINYLKTNKFTQQALVPSIGWKKSEQQTLVENISLSGQMLSWNYSKDNVRYAIYAIPNSNRNDSSVFSTSLYLLGISYSKQFELPNEVNAADYKIAVSVLDRYGNEYSPRVMGENVVGQEMARPLYPADNSINTIIPTAFKWYSVNGADSYIWEVAKDNLFNNLLCARETTDTAFFSGLEPQMKENTTYYWRIRTRKANMADSYSEIFSFNGNKFKITSPSNGSTSVSIMPTITWTKLNSSTANYTLEISNSSDFNEDVYKKTSAATSLEIPVNTLVSGTTYYARVKVVDGIINATSETIIFTTEELEITIPVLLTPQNGETISGSEIELTWEEQNSKGFRTELSQDPSFPTRGTTLKSVDAFTYSVVYSDLDVGTYYVRVRAKNSDGLTDPSETVKVYLGTSAVPNTTADKECYSYYDQAGNCYVLINNKTASAATLQIYALTGVLLNSNTINLTIGENRVLTDLVNCNSGVYILKVKINNTETILKIKK